MPPKVDLSVGIIGFISGIIAFAILGTQKVEVLIILLFLILFSLNAIYRGRKNLRVEKGLGLHTLAADPKIVHFLKNSYQSWQSGKLSHLSEQYEIKTHKRSATSLVESLLSDKAILSVLNAAFDLSAPEDDEIFLAILPGSCLLTNKRITLLGNKPMAVKLDDISDYNSSGTSDTACTLKLTTGEIIEPSGIKQVPTNETMNRLITQAS